MASLLPAQDLIRALRTRVRSVLSNLSTPTSAKEPSARPGPDAVDRLSAQLHAAVYGPLRPFPLVRVPAPAVSGGSGHAAAVHEADGQALRPSLHPRDFYQDLAKLDVPSATLRAVHAFIATLPSWLAPPLARRRGETQIELQWNTRDARYFRAVIGHDAMVIYSARLGERGRLDGAEPVGERLSPIVMHAIRQLGL